jgi:hypothetical protein
MVQRSVGLLAVELLLLVSTERPAKAYVDPGSGALVWQGLLATIVGSAFYIRRVVGWVKTRLFHGKRGARPCQ